ncbi:uncharacterized protein [Dendrobates tinctorius]|uniref:uncharacterized protein n=1 Tax=Dendrobates tinctorius TaxID=92724 RepID=UPI003CC97C1D
MAGHDLKPVDLAYYTIWAETEVRTPSPPPPHCLRVTPAQSPSLRKAPPAPESLHQIPEVQDGVSKIGNPSYWAGLADGYDRPEGRLLPCPNSSGSPEVPEVRGLPRPGISHLQFNALPFGVSPAPRVFTKILREAVISIRLQGICIVPYLDDLLIVAPSVSRLNQDVSKTLQMLESLGWILNLQKSDLHPSPRKKFLGVLLDSEKRTSFLPEDRQSDLRQRIIRFREQRAPTLRDAMSILGSLTSFIQAVSWVQAHMRILQSYVLVNARKYPNNLSKKESTSRTRKIGPLVVAELPQLEMGNKLGPASSENTLY